MWTQSTRREPDGRVSWAGANLKAFESPLIPHARMRGLYRALVEVRELGPQLGVRRLPRGLEACWVGPAIGLEADDLVSDLRQSSALEYIRTVGSRSGDRGPTLQPLRRALAPGIQTFTMPLGERLMYAAGMAMATAAARRKGVVVVFFSAEEPPAVGARRLSAVASNATLPMVLVQVPAAQRRGETNRGGGVHRSASALALPVIQVDAGDAVALYRVAQESLGRARAGGGAVLIDCVRTGTDPIQTLRKQLLLKGICNTRWIDGVDASMARLLPLV